MHKVPKIGSYSGFQFISILQLRTAMMKSAEGSYIGRELETEAFLETKSGLTKHSINSPSG